MNHGYCKNCWWWKCESAIHPSKISKEYREVWESLTDKPFPKSDGKCYMQNSNAGPYKVTKEDDYCQDYTNRKKEEKKYGTLDEFIKTL